jgi:hypothetical protein
MTLASPAMSSSPHSATGGSAHLSGPPFAERDAVASHLPAVLELHCLKTPQADIDILPSELERGRQHRSITRGLSCRARCVRSDHKGGIAEQADPAEDRAWHYHVDDRLPGLLPTSADPKADIAVLETP